MAERVSGNLKASEDYYYESIAALDGMDVPRSLGLRKMEFGLLMRQAGDDVKARRFLEESRVLFQRVGAADMVARVGKELGP
jgi:hypothetical protein